MRPHTLPRHRGFTLPELLVISVCLAALLAVALPACGPRRGPIPIKDSTQLRSIMQGFIQFAAANRDRYPEPARVDRFDDTEGSMPGALYSHFADPDKNRTGAILSMAIYQNLFIPEVCVSPGDTGNVRVFDEYQFQNPDGANTPARAIYDPAFNGTPFDSANDPHCPNNVAANGGRDDASHNSYAHNCIAFARNADWKGSASPTTPVWAHRGPVYANDTRTTQGSNARDWEVLENDPLGDQSHAVLIWGERGAWRGNVAYADSSVSFEESPQPQAATFTVTDGSGQQTVVADNIFVDEHFELADPTDHAGRRNAYLRQWKRGIPSRLAADEFDYVTYLAPTNDATGYAFTD